VNDRPTALERAFQLASSGRPNTIADIKKTLHSEGYLTTQIDGQALHRQLRALILAARVSCSAAPEAEAE
jgi:hypothetical protein